MNKKVIIGMSGGVDSSVAAYLLKQQGYEVIGVTFKFINDFNPDDAKLVCDKLDIEHHVVDYTNEFNKLVIDSFINDYKNGITPNPCVTCNRDVKIKFLFDEMKKHNADYIATGHYAKFINNKLYRSADLNKDQTYFLSLVPLQKLQHILFPLEGINKEEVRRIANEIGLLNANKKDSYDVCFIKSSFSDFITQHIPAKKGPVINIKTNEVLGEHKGLSYYTIGQRRGLDIGGTPDRMFVVGKNVKENILYVSIGEDEYLECDECIIENVNLISYHHPTFCTVKYRYASGDVSASIEYLENNEIKVKLLSKVRAVTPGQTVAIYLGEECIGGGIIKNVLKNNEKLWYL